MTSPSCRIQLTQIPDHYSVRDEAVLLDGQPIDPGNWVWDKSQKPPSVVITGSDCERIQHFQVSQITVKFLCAGSST